MAGLKGTKTEKNILAAFAGESQARNRYTYFASKAKKEGYVQVSNVFLEAAGNEKEHAKRLFKFLEGGEAEITASFPAGVIGTTADNKIAAEEGFSEVAEVMKAVAVAEKQHEKRYLGLLKNIEKGRVFKKKESVKWICGNCGYVHEGESAPEKCPACAHPTAYFELLCENW